MTKYCILASEGDGKMVIMLLGVLVGTFVITAAAVFGTIAVTAGIGYGIFCLVKAIWCSGMI
jgi:hypothetical protein